MFVSGRPKSEHYWKHLSLNQFLFLFIILTTAHQLLAENDLLETSTTNGIATLNGLACAERWTCTSCTEGMTPSCSWSVVEQMCVDNVAEAAQSRLMVTDRSSCPKFSVDNRVGTAADNNMTITVTINDSAMGGRFVELLANSSVKCQLKNENITTVVNGDRISCAPVHIRSDYKVKCRYFEPVFSHFLILFDGKFLRFDNESDHYVFNYPSDCSRIDYEHFNRNNGTHRCYCTWLDNKTRSANITSFKKYCDMRNNLNFTKLGFANKEIDEMCLYKGPVVVKDSVTPKTMLQSDRLKPKDPVGDNNSSSIVPTVNAGQKFGGIVSGNTKFMVQGQSCESLYNVKVCTTDYNQTCSRCNVHNDTFMECKSPKFVINDPQPRLVMKQLKFKADIFPGSVQVNPNSWLIEYYLYQDPVFTDFVVNGCCNVTVNGLHLDLGYAANDLSIVLDSENSSSRCLIILMNSTQITCQLPLSRSPPSQLDPLPKQINITVGDYFRVLTLTKRKSSHFKNSLAGIILPGIVTIGAYVSFIAVLCVALIFFKSSKDYDLLHLHGRQNLEEMRSLNEKNFNDYDNDSESKNMLPVRDKRH
ncbi:uncharacterized protein LOC112599313 isoform X2 [Melanaphis sacchari]|nr:uncharacterized protein LOC112599313 isoform X2 [Melanaphis sacchari]